MNPLLQEEDSLTSTFIFVCLIQYKFNYLLHRYYRTAFDAGKLPECSKISLMDVEVQTEIRNRFRLDPSDSERK